MAEPQVTIAIPVRNAAGTIARAVESALAQEDVAAELIVVDDGSTDATPERLREFGERLRVITQPARGGNAARNAAWQAARGEWVQFLDADDELVPDKIARQLREAGDDAARPQLLLAPVLVDEAGRREPSPLDLRRDLFASWLSWELPQTGGGLWRRSLLERLGGWDEALPCCQEHELYLRALFAGAPVALTPSAGAVYHIASQDTVCRRDPVRVVEVRTALMDAALVWLAEHGRRTAEHQRIAGRAAFEMARTLAQTDPSRAAAYLAERRARGCVEVAGPAAPWRYRVVYRTAGFRAAERLAAWSRG